MSGPDDELTVGELASRAGVSVSTLHFYERNGLITAHRTSGNQRRYPRSTLRRVAFIRTSVRIGVPLARIRTALDSLPAGRTPTRRDWTRLSRRWRADLDARIEALVALRDGLDACIGCGCLSLQKCRLANPDDALAAEGPGARLLPE
jgi:MerR family transcriptional regulator, redox-sensitive transcriptional activator SoxR